MFASSYRVGRLIGAGLLLHSEAESRLIAAGDHLGLPKNAVYRQVRRGLAKGCENPRVPLQRIDLENAGQARLAIVEWWQAIADDPAATEGRRGPQRLRLLQALYDIAMRAGTSTLHESYRELAEKAGVAHATICKYVRAGELDRWVAITAGGGLAHEGTRSTWTLRLAIVNRPDAVSASSGIVAALDETARSERREHAARHVDAWQGWVGGWLVYNALTDEAQTVSELAAITRRCAGSVRRNLHRLQKLGLVQHCEDGWKALAVVDVPIVTTHCQTARLRRHAEDREVHRRRVAWLITERERAQELRTVDVFANDAIAHRPRRPRGQYMPRKMTNAERQAQRLTSAMAGTRAR